MEMSEVFVGTELVEILLELRPIVSEHMFDLIWKQLGHEVQKVCHGFGRMRDSGTGEACARIQIFCNQNVHSYSISLFLNGIESDAVTGIQRSEILGFSKNFLAIHLDDVSPASKLKWRNSQTSEICDQSSDGGNRGTWKMNRVSIFLEEWVHLFFSEVLSLFSNPSKLIEYASVPHSLPSVLWNTFDRVECFQFSVTGTQSSLPVEEGSSTDAEGFVCRFSSVFFPKCQYPCSLFCLFGDHIPKAYHSMPCAHKPFCSFKFVENSHLFRVAKECNMYLSLDSQTICQCSDVILLNRL